MLHAHLRGIKLILRHYRNGVEQEPITEEKSYDFNFQEFNVLPKPRTVKMVNVKKKNNKS